MGNEVETPAEFICGYGVRQVWSYSGDLPSRVVVRGSSTGVGEHTRAKMMFSSVEFELCFHLEKRARPNKKRERCPRTFRSQTPIAASTADVAVLPTS